MSMYFFVEILSYLLLFLSLYTWSLIEGCFLARKFQWFYFPKTETRFGFAIALDYELCESCLLCIFSFRLLNLATCDFLYALALFACVLPS